MSVPTKQTETFEQAALASYLRDLGFENLLLPDGLPDTFDGSVKPVAAKRRAEGERPSTAGRRPNREAAKGISVANPEMEAACFDLSRDLPSADEMDRAARLALADKSAKTCTACGLSQKRTKVVFGSGSETANLMLVGEGPGAREDQQGEPFVGPAGELLTKMLEAIEIERSEVYIANIVKCRPPGNRDPRPEEIKACSGYLAAQIELVRPRIILTLGRVAAQALLASTQTLGRLRNRWHEYCGVPVWVTYHPAALLRNASYKRPAWEDLQLVRDRLKALSATQQSDD